MKREVYINMPKFTMSKGKSLMKQVALLSPPKIHTVWQTQNSTKEKEKL